jgi:glycosyltransferase involved in cell wall biosynthesis
MYGADRILLQLIEGLDKERFRPIVVLPNDVPYRGLLSQALRQHGVQTIHLRLAVLRRQYFTVLGVSRYLFRLATSMFKLVRLIRRESVDLVHSHTAAVVSGALAAHLTRTPHVWQTLEIIVRPRFVRRLLAWLMPRLADQVVAGSGPTRDHLWAEDQLNQKRVVVIHNGVDVSRFDSARGLGRQVRGEWAIKPEQPLVGMIGRVNHWKGQDYFVRAAHLVRRSHPDARFALVGGPVHGQEHLIQNLKALVAELDLSSAVIISDFRSDAPSVLDAYDVFVLPSTLPDPFPTVILEAMAAGKPVVANAHGGALELVEHGITGLLVKPGQLSEMAAAINRLLDDTPERLMMGKRGRDRVVTHFSIEAFVKTYAALYTRVLSQSL